jgi:hypothetical protein
MSMRSQHSRCIPAARVLSMLLATISVMFNVTTGNAAELKIQRIRIESTPAGAAVSTIVGKHGVTPLSITERDIYPNTYPETKVDLYGKVVISKSGCKTVTRRVTLGDIKQGLDIQLDCTESTPVVKLETGGKLQAIQEVKRSATPITEALSERRLRQLKVLNELLDDKLISAEEEQSIRKRIFERLNQ